MIAKDDDENRRFDSAFAAQHSPSHLIRTLVTARRRLVQEMLLNYPLRRNVVSAAGDPYLSASEIG